MNKVAVEIQRLHREIDETPEGKLKVIDNCMEMEVKKWPCSKREYGIPNEKSEKIDRLYGELL